LNQTTEDTQGVEVKVKLYCNLVACCLLLFQSQTGGFIYYRGYVAVLVLPTIYGNKKQCIAVLHESRLYFTLSQHNKLDSDMVAND
jgi:hypothetical protein